MDKQTAQAQNIILENRRELRVSGVKDIDCFTESKVVLSTVMGELVVKGQELHVNTLETDTGDFYMTGRINSMTYNSFSSADSAVKKLFR